MLSTLDMENKHEAWDRIAEQYEAEFGDDGDFAHKYIIEPALEAEMGSVENKAIADLGSGNGAFAKKLANRGAKVIGIDSSVEMIRYASSRSNSNLHFVRADLEKEFPIKSNICDIITAVMVFHTIDNIDFSLAEASRILKKSGEMYIVVPHPAYVKNFRSVEGLDENKYLSSQKARFTWKQLSDVCDIPTQFIARSFQNYLMLFKYNNLIIDNILEPSINESALEDLDDIRTIDVYNRLKEKPNFVIFKLKKTNATS